MKNYNVYIISNKNNNDLYIGTTSLEINDRFKIHRQHLNSKCSNIENRSSLYLDMAKYGIDSFNISLLKNNLTKKHALKIEAEFQNNDVRFKKYAKKDLARDCRPKFNSCYKLISEDDILFYKSTVEIAKKFNCHKTNVTRSLNDGYLFLKKYLIVRITTEEYNNSIGIESFNF